MSKESVDGKSDETLTDTVLYSYGRKQFVEELEINKDKIKSFKSITPFPPSYPYEYNHFYITDYDGNIWFHQNAGWTQIDFFKQNNISIAKINVTMDSLRFKTYWITKDMNAWMSDSKLTEQIDIAGYDDIIDIQPGEFFAVALCVSRTLSPDKFKKILFYWFRVANVNNNVKQLPDSIAALIIDYDTMVKVLRKGGCYKMIDNEEQWVQLREFEEIEGNGFENESIVCIECHSDGPESVFFVNDHGEVWAFGDDNDALGLGKLAKKHYSHARNNEPDKIPYFVENKIFVTKVCCGKTHTLALDENGKVHSWGKNYFAQIGRSTKSPEYPGMIEKLKEFVVADIKAEWDNSYARSQDDLHFVWGDNRWGQLKFNEMKETYNVYENREETIREYKVREPLLINDLFYEKIGKKVMIKDVCFGVTVMLIIAINKEQD